MRLADREAGAAQLLWRILSAVTSTLGTRYEAVQQMGTVDFDQRPYFRVLSNLLLDLAEAVREEWLGPAQAEAGGIGLQQPHSTPSAAARRRTGDEEYVYSRVSTEQRE